MSKIDELMTELGHYALRPDDEFVCDTDEHKALTEEIAKLQQAVTPGASLNYLVAQVEALGASCEAGPLVNSAAWLATKAGIVELQQVLTTQSALLHAPRAVEPASQELLDADSQIDGCMAGESETLAEPEDAAAWVIVRAALPGVAP